MSFYLGAGFRCRRSIGCGFRVMPANGDDWALNEAARLRKGHEAGCPIAGAVPDEPLGNLDDLASRLAAQRVDAEDRERRPRTFRCVCQVCHEPFEASGPRASYCPKARCQAARGAPVPA